MEPQWFWNQPARNTGLLQSTGWWSYPNLLMLKTLTTSLRRMWVTIPFNFTPKINTQFGHFQLIVASDENGDVADPHQSGSAWVAGSFPGLDTKYRFLLGTGQKVGKFVNLQLKDGVEYKVFLRAFIDETTTDAEKVISIIDRSLFNSFHKLFHLELRHESLF